MTTSTADDDPPWCYHNSICTATAPPPIRELITAKDDTRGTDSTRYPNTTILREIPTRISPSAPTDAVVARHDGDQQPHQRCPNLLLPPTNPNNVHLFLSSPPTNDDYVDNTLDNINKMMRSWPSVRAPIAAVVVQHDDDTDRPPHQTRPDLPPTQKEPTSVPHFLYAQSTTDDSVECTLDKINKMMHSWPSASARKPWTTTMLPATPPPLTPAQVPRQLPPNTTIPEVTRHLHDTISPASFIDRRDDADRCDDTDRPKSDNVHPPLSLQATFDLQLQVIEKISNVCNGLNNLLDRYIAAFTRPPTDRTLPSCMTPATILTVHGSSLFPEPNATLVTLKHHIALTLTTIIPYVKPIPAKPPYRCNNRHGAMLTKDGMRPP